MSYKVKDAQLSGEKLNLNTCCHFPSQPWLLLVGIRNLLLCSELEEPRLSYQGSASLGAASLLSGGLGSARVVRCKPVVSQCVEGLLSPEPESRPSVWPGSHRGLMLGGTGKMSWAHSLRSILLGSGRSGGERVLFRRLGSVGGGWKRGVGVKMNKKLSIIYVDENFK